MADTNVPEVKNRPREAASRTTRDAGGSLANRIRAARRASRASAARTRARPEATSR